MLQVWAAYAEVRLPDVRAPAVLFLHVLAAEIRMSTSPHTKSTSQRWVLIALGDGYETHIVTGREAMERKFLELHFGPTRPATECSPAEVEQMEGMLASLRDEDNWVRNYSLGPVGFTQDNEDGNVYVYLLTDDEVTRG